MSDTDTTKAEFILMDFVENEHRILEFWEREQIFKKLQEKNKRGKPWSFFDGPITANNPMGVHHAWGRTLKDFFQRYKAMQGFDQRYQNGFDCQGLWVEVEVEKDLGFNSKKDIEAFGLEKFSRACSERVKKFAALITEQSKRLGQWMDWEHSYFTMSEENNLHIWQFLKRCHEKGWIRKGTDVVPWCWRCGTGISQHELSDGGYADVTHETVYVALPLISRNSVILERSPKGEAIESSPGSYRPAAGLQDDRSEAFLVWTTTPWTLLANVAAAVNPELEYVKVRSGERKGVWLARDRVAAVFGSDVEVLETKKGKGLVGWTYEGPFDDLPASNVPHRIVAWDAVSAEEGSGIVHIAPGCGKEDHDVGVREKLPLIDPIEEDGTYRSGFGQFTGKKAQDVSKDVRKALEEKGILVKRESITHSYPICWRCKEQLLFRVSAEWFIDATEIRPLMKKAAKTAEWIPELGGKRMQDWLDNMGDWPISRKRYWGLALPFFECPCGELTVVGSKKELRGLAVDPKKVDTLPELHRPWIDAVKICCPKCHKEVSRIPDVGDCWLDAGIIPFSTLKYPTPDDRGDVKYWKTWFPAEHVSESVSQVKLWFYTLLFMSVTLEEKAPYKRVIAYGSVVDEKGKPMHKSLGNAIWFDDAVEKMGADVMRWVYLRGQYEDNVRFGFKVGEEMKRKLLVLWNVVQFYKLFSPIKGGGDTEGEETVLDLWIQARLNDTVCRVSEVLNSFRTAEAVKLLEDFAEDLSTWYVRRSRERVKEGDRTPIRILGEVLAVLARIMAPFTPFLAESMYQEIKVRTKESVHLEEWPIVVEHPDNEILGVMETVRKFCELAHSIRAEAGIPVRQPLAELVYDGKELTNEYEQLIVDEVNVLAVKKGKPKKQFAAKEEGSMKVGIDLVLTPELERAGIARELTRAINQFRKELGLQAVDTVPLAIETADASVLEALTQHGDDVYRATHGIRGTLKESKEKEVAIRNANVVIRVQV